MIPWRPQCLLSPVILDPKSAMKWKLPLITATSVLSLTGLVQAQESKMIPPANSSIGNDSKQLLNQAMKASDLIGLKVKNHQGENLGEVENLVLDLSASHLIAVIISSAEVLAVGSDWRAVPPASFRFDAPSQALLLDITPDRLAEAPHFNSNQWPDFSQPVVLDAIYKAYQVNAITTAPGMSGADKSSLNQRDRNPVTLTPLDQGSSKNDLEITTRIRKSILANEEMSVNAQNVKIITANGKVTLRGPVSTAEEKRLVGDIAVQSAGLENVDNQLEVK